MSTAFAELCNGLRMRMVELDDGVRLRTWTTGTATGLPPVVLLHGGPGLWDNLAPVAELLDSVTVVHRFDQRGCGGSDPSSDLTMDRWLADIEGLRLHWGHEHWIVIGHSFGATLALAYAVANPRRTLAMAYLSGVGIGDWRSSVREVERRRRTPQQQQRRAELKALADRSPDEEVEFRALCWFTDYADPEQGWRWALADARADLPINWAANRALTVDLTSDVLTRAGQLDMPCWFIHGDKDPRPSRTVAELAAMVPESEFRLIHGAGHQPWRERPAELTGLLRALISSTTG